MSLGRAIATVGGFTLLSRVVGFIRDIVLSAVLGSGAIADAFFVAFRLPNFFRRLFAEGAFSAAFVPLFASELQGNGRDAAVTFARQAHAALLVVLIPFSIVLILGMPQVLAVIAPGLRAEPATFEMAVTFGRIAFPYLVFISLASLYGGVLNGIDRFAEVAVAAVLLNHALIGAVLGLTPFLPNAGFAAAIGVAIAGFLQWLWLLFSCSRDGVGMKLVRPRWTARVARLVKLATPVAIGGGAQQVSVVLDVVWASLMPVGTISALYYADRIAQLPLGVVGIAVGTALLPLLSRQLRAGQHEAAMANQNRAIEFGLLFSLPSMVALWLLADPIVRVLFERGKFARGLCDRPAGLRAGEGADARLLRPRGHAHAALCRCRIDRVQRRFEHGLPVLYVARSGRHRARDHALGLAQYALAGGDPAPARPVDSRRPADVTLRAHAARERGHGGGALVWFDAAPVGTVPCRSCRCRSTRRDLRLGRPCLRTIGAGVADREPHRPSVPAPTCERACRTDYANRPKRTTVTPGRSGRLDEGITSTQSS